MGQLPTSVRRSIWTVWALVVWGVVATVLTVLLRDDLILAWAEGNPSPRRSSTPGGSTLSRTARSGSPASWRSP